jgi:hypothetical protein
MISTHGVKALIVVLLPLASAFSLAGVPVGPQRELAPSRYSSSAFRSGSASRSAYTPLFSGSKPEIILPQNEFSRPLQTERILRMKRDYLIDLEASTEECKALAGRFDLSDIAKLEATLKLRQESIGGKGYSTGVEVDGTVFASVTQRCVRTNEDFQVDLEFPLYCIVRPVVPMYALMNGGGGEEAQSNTVPEKREEKSNNKPKRNVKVGEMDMMQLQRMLQQDISDEDDMLMEDEMIYPCDGALDVGELVAQLFFLKMDPYPKKPGSDFTSFTITG